MDFQSALRFSLTSLKTPITAALDRLSAHYLRPRLRMYRPDLPLLAGPPSPGQDKRFEPRPPGLGPLSWGFES
eukprot:8122262-Pyramimonas_sp.AAC.2